MNNHKLRIFGLFHLFWAYAGDLKKVLEAKRPILAYPRGSRGGFRRSGGLCWAYPGGLEQVWGPGGLFWAYPWSFVQVWGSGAYFGPIKGSGVGFAVQEAYFGLPD